MLFKSSVRQAAKLIRQVPKWIQQLLLSGLLFCLWVWHRFVSPLFGKRCRFQPSCSCYAMEALERYGFWRGSFLIIKRICRCHPGCPGGLDPVP